MPNPASGLFERLLPIFQHLARLAPVLLAAGGLVCATEALAQCDGETCSCTTGLSCTCLPQSCSCGAGTACTLVSTGPARLVCNDAPCTFVAGHAASVECRGLGPCNGSVGSEGIVACTGSGPCTLLVGANSDVTCTGTGPCSIACESSCRFHCGGTFCTLSCNGGGAQRADCGSREQACGACADAGVADAGSLEDAGSGPDAGEGVGLDAGSPAPSADGGQPPGSADASPPEFPPRGGMALRVGCDCTAVGPGPFALIAVVIAFVQRHGRRR